MDNRRKKTHNMRDRETKLTCVLNKQHYYGDHDAKQTSARYGR